MDDDGSESGGTPRKRRWRRWVLLGLLALLVASPWIARPWLQGLLGRKIAATLSGAIDCVAEVGDVELAYFPLRLGLRELTLDCGDEGRASVEETRAVVVFSSLLRGRIVVGQLEVHSPAVEARGIPEVEKSGTGSGAGRFAIEAFRLTNGRLRYIDEEHDLDISTSAIEIESSELFKDGRYGAHLFSAKGELVVAGRRIESLSTTAEVRGDSRAVELTRGTLEAEGFGRIEAEGRIVLDESPPRYDLGFELSAGSTRLVQLLGLDEQVTTTGDVRWTGRVEGSGETWRIGGDARAPDLTVLGLPVAGPRADVGLARGGLRVDDLNASVLGGTLDGGVRIGMGERKGQIESRVRLEGADLESVPPLAGFSPPPLATTLDLQADVSVPLSDPAGATGTARLSATPKASATDSGPPAPGAVLDTRIAEGGLRGIEASVDFAGGHAEATGGLDFGGALDVDATVEIASIEETTRQLAARYPELAPLRDAELSGALRWSGAAGGDVQNPSIDGGLRGGPLFLGDTPLGELRGRLRFVDGTLSFEGFELLGDLTELRASGEVSIGFPVEWAFDWEIDRLDAEVLSHLLEAPRDLEGTLSGRGHIARGEGSPTVRGTIRGGPFAVDDVRVADEFELDAGFGAEGLHLERLLVRLGDGTISADGALPRSADDEGGAGIRLRVDEYAAGALSLNEAFEGTLSVTGSVGGSLTRPTTPETLVFRAQQVSLSDRFDPIDLAGRLRVRDGRLRLQIGDESQRVAGEAELTLDDSLELRAWADVSAFDWVLLSDPEVGELRVLFGEARFELDGSLLALEEVEAKLEIARLVATVADSRAETRDPVILRASRRKVVLPETVVQVGSREVVVGGEAELGEPLRYDVTLEGSGDLTFLDALIPQARIDGASELNLRVHGEGSAPRLNGSLEVTDGYFNLRDVPTALEDVTASVELVDRTVRIRRLSAGIGGGSVDVTGEARLGDNNEVAFRLEAAGRQIAFRYPRDFSAMTDLDVVLEGNLKRATLSGELKLLHGRYSKNMNLERSMFSSGRTIEPPAVAGALDALQLDLTVDIPGRMWMDNDVGRVEVEGRLRVTGPIARPALNGGLDLVSPGRLKFQRVHYTLTQASVSFSPAFPKDPTVDLLMFTEIAPYNIRVQATGRTSDLRIDLFSQPFLESEDIAVMLLSGGLWRRGGEAFGGTSWDRTETSRAADWIHGTMRGDSDPLSAGSIDDPASQLTLGKSLSPRLSTALSTDLGGSGTSVIELRYRLHPYVELRQMRNSLAEDTSEIRYVRSFRIGRQKAPREQPPATPVDGFRIDEIILEGLPDPPGEKPVRAVLTPPASGIIELSHLKVAEARVRQVMSDSGYPLARVSCEPRKTDSRTDLHCKTTPGPQAALEIRGELRDKEKRKLTARIRDDWLDMRSPRALLDQSIHSAQSFYQARGQSRAVVNGEVEETDGGLTVTLDVEPGPVVRITDVRLEGTGQLAESTLRKSMLTDKRAHGRHPLLADDLIDGDRDALYRVYYSSGFMDVRVLPADVQFPESDDAATVVFTIEEGPRRKLLDVRFDGNDAFEAEELKGRLSIPEESWVDTRDLDEMAAKIAAAYHEQGLPEATALWSLEPLDDGARATFKINEGIPIEIGEIIVSGNRQVKERTIRRELTFATGEPLRRDRLLETQRKLRQKGMFQSVVIRSRPAEGREGVWDVVVRVRERDMLDLSVGVGFDDTERWRVSFSAGRHLIAGRAGSVWFNVRWGEEVSVGNLATGWRQVAGSKNDFLGSVGFSQRKRDGFTEEGPFLFAQVNRPLTERTTVLAQYELQDVRFSSFNLTVTDPEDNSGLLGSISAGLVRTTIDDPALPRSGGLGAADLALFSEYVGSDYEFLRLVAGQSLVFGAKSGRFTSISSARIGFSWPHGNTVTVPLTERFFAGGIGSVRGYDRDELGPKDPVTGDPIGGASLFVFTQEIRIQVARRSFLHLFVDGGNVFFRPVDFAFNDLEFTFGPGFSLATPAGPVAIFYGRKIDPDPDEDPGRWHFTFGRIF